MADETPEDETPEEGETPKEDDEEKDNKPDFSGPVVHPGHRLNVWVERNTNPAEHGPAPWLAITRRKGHRYPAVGFDTAEEANKYAREAVRKADRGLREDERSEWD